MFPVLDLEVHELHVAVPAGLIALYVEKPQGIDEGRKFGKAEIPHVEIRKPLGQLVPKLCGEDPAVVVGAFLGEGQNGLFDHLEVGLGLRFLGLLSGFLCGGRLLLLCRGRLFLVGGRLDLLFRVRVGLVGEEDVQIFELVAGGDEWLRRLALPHADDLHAGFPKPCRQPGEIAVRGGQAEAVDGSRIENVHGVDDHGRVGGTLPGGVSVLLDGDDGIVQENPFPGGELGVGPVPVDSFVGGNAVFCGFVQDNIDVFFGNVVCVDQYGVFQFFVQKCASVLSNYYL